MTDGTAFRRGDVLLLRLPHVTDLSHTKARPAVVVQNDVGNRFSPNLIVAAISSQLPRRAYPTNLVLRQDSPEAEGTGLERDSVVQAELIFTVRKDLVIRRLGRFGDTTMRAIDERLKASLGLA